MQSLNGKHTELVVEDSAGSVDGVDSTWQTMVKY
jgi:hypothetical protein